MRNRQGIWQNVGLTSLGARAQSSQNEAEQAILRGRHWTLRPIAFQNGEKVGEIWHTGALNEPGGMFSMRIERKLVGQADDQVSRDARVASRTRRARVLKVSRTSARKSRALERARPKTDMRLKPQPSKVALRPSTALRARG